MTYDTGIYSNTMRGADNGAFHHTVPSFDHRKKTMNTSEIRNELERRKGERNQLQRNVHEIKSKIKSQSNLLKDIEEAQTIIQAVAQATQSELEFHISELVSLALEAVFPNPYSFHLDFEVRRNQTEADISFSSRNSEERIHPLNAAGGGVCDITAFALRIALWSLERPRTRETLILDEPFKNINDPGNKSGLHLKAAEMMKMLSERLGLQMIVVTLNDELIEVADKVFEVTKKQKISRVKELR